MEMNIMEPVINGLAYLESLGLELWQVAVLGIMAVLIISGGFDPPQPRQKKRDPGKVHDMDAWYKNVHTKWKD